MRKKPKIGIALGSGAVRGFSHIGVLEVLEAAGIRPDLIAGTSIGAVIGAFYAAGLSTHQMRELATKPKLQDLIDFTQLKTGIIAGAKIEAYLRKNLQNKQFSELNIPLYIVATEIIRAEKIVFSKGDLTKAVRASIAIPGVFQPQQIGKHKFVDGGLVDPIPVDVLHEKGADIIIAVDLSLNLKEKEVFVFNKTELTDFLKKEFIISETTVLHDFIKLFFFKMPNFIEKMLDKLIEWLFSPTKLFNLLTKNEPPEIVQTFIRSIEILNNQLSKEELTKEYVNLAIHPTFHGVKFAEFDRAEYCIEQGRIAAKKALPKLKKIIASYERKAKRAKQSN